MFIKYITNAMATSVAKVRQIYSGIQFQIGAVMENKGLRNDEFCICYRHP